jgi:putative ABC transport system permease protein
MAVKERSPGTVAPPSPLPETGPASDKELEGGGSPFGAVFVSVMMALRGLSANKLRSVLTMLGVIIGVGAVIIAIAIGTGSREAVAESIQRLGTNVLTVRAGQQRRGQISFGGNNNTLTLADADAILKEISSIQRVSPTVERNLQIKYENKNTNVSVNGNGEHYPVISNHPIAKGRYFNASEQRSYKRVAVLGATTAKDLFDRQSPIGKTIRIAGQNFEVIGLLKEKGGQGFRNPDDAVYVPVSTAMRRLLGVQNITGITCQARSFGVMGRAQKEIETLLRKRHKITGETNDFMIFNQADLADAQNAQQDTFSSLITYLAIVSLVVGGIGIMNIMLVSVTERTREIGVRKAIGARRRDILGQFLLEALFLSLVGGLLGVAFGIVGSNFVSNANNWKVVVAPGTVLLAFSFSAIIGVFFGFYPALKASKLRPIEALRYE